MRVRFPPTLLLMSLGIVLLAACGSQDAGAVPQRDVTAQAGMPILATEGGENPGQVLRIDLALESKVDNSFVLLVRVTNQSAQPVTITDITTGYPWWGWSTYVLGPDGEYWVVPPPAPAPPPPSETDLIELAPGATQEARLWLGEGYVSRSNGRRNTLPDTPGTYQVTMIYDHRRPGLGQDLTLPASRSRTLVFTITAAGGVTVPPATKKASAP